MLNDFKYRKETERLLASVGEERFNALWNWELSELDNEFVGFIDKYATLNVPKDFTVIDLGCYQAVQADYFKDCKAYIGVEPDVPPEYRLQQDNAKYYQQTGQEFIKHILPRLLEQGLDLNKTIAVCSAVPDEELQQLVIKTFPYHRVTYPNRGDDLISEALPNSKIRTKDNYER